MLRRPVSGRNYNNAPRIKAIVIVRAVIDVRVIAYEARIRLVRSREPTKVLLKRLRTRDSSASTIGETSKLQRTTR
jgi:hypothetical protein